MSEEEGWDDYESGPFCRHWNEPGFCDDKCTCGHTCDQHDPWEDDCRECDCKGWVEPEGTIK